MNESEIRSLLAQLIREHSQDKDGGYELVDDILRLHSSLDTSDQKAVRNFLLELVARREFTTALKSYLGNQS